MVMVAPTVGAAEYTPKIQKRTLKGHRKPVLCLAHASERLAHGSLPRAPQPPTPNLLLSGSEDGTARLWDLRTRKTALCLVVPGSENGGEHDVTSVAFHPSIHGHPVPVVPTSNSGSGNGPLPLPHECTVYVSTSNHVYSYDLRHHAATSTAPIVKTPHLDLSSHFQCSDEINELSFSFPKQGGKYFMSAADDSGEVHVAECVQRSSQNTTTTKHKTFCHAAPEAMATTAAFQPGTNNESYLATGGTDCTIKLWDASRPRRPTATIHITPSQGDNPLQLCNPPYVHSLAWSPSGRLLAAGLGDGAVAILRAEGRRMTDVVRLGRPAGGHTAAVAAVRFAGLGTCDDRLLVSAGNDGRAVFWDLGGDAAPGAADPAARLGGEGASAPADGADAKALATQGDAADGACERARGKKGRRNGTPRKKGAAAVAGGEKEPSPPRALFQIAHGRKPNWIACGRATDAGLPAALFVADTTNHISVYALPI